MHTLAFDINIQDPLCAGTIVEPLSSLKNGVSAVQSHLVGLAKM